MIEQSPLWSEPHRHVWLRAGRLIEICSSCPAARRRSRAARAFSTVVLALGMLAAVAMLVRISLGDRRITLASCASFATHASPAGARPGC